MLRLPQLHDEPPGEGCGPCHACCEVVAVQDLGKPPYARCTNLRAGGPAGPCGVYPDRPAQCRDYRCAWHLGLLGTRVDRRPNESGLLFQLEPQAGGCWQLTAYEVKPGAAAAERVRYLAQLIAASKKARGLAILPDVHVMTFGADLPIAYPPAAIYAYRSPPPGAPLRREGPLLIFDGQTRPLLMPTGVAPAPEGATETAGYESSTPELL